MVKIRFHEKSMTLVVMRNSFFDRAVRSDRNLLIGPFADIRGSLQVGGRLDLGMGAKVRGNIHAESAVIGSEVSIMGSIFTEKDLAIMDNTEVRGNAESGGDLMVNQGVQIRSAKALGNIFINGSPSIVELHAGGRVIARKG